MLYNPWQRDNASLHSSSLTRKMSQTMRQTRSKDSAKKDSKIEKDETMPPPETKTSIPNDTETLKRKDFQTVLTNGMEGTSQEKEEMPTEKESNTTSPHLDKKPFKTYIHNVTELKLSRKNFSYFNFKLQTESSVIPGVCYDTIFQKILQTKEETQQAIEIADYGLKRSLNENQMDSLVVNKRTKIRNTSDCNFGFTEIEENNLVKVNDISSIPDFTSITLIGKINIISKHEKVTVGEKELSKLECKIGDETGSINITFWENQIERVTNKLTYKISNVKVRTFQGKKCLSLNPQSQIANAEPLTNVAETLFNKEDVDGVVEAEQVDCIGTFSAFNSCKNCNKKIQPLQGKLQKCTSCGAKQIVNIDKEKTNYSLVLIFKEPSLSLTIFKKQMQQLINLYNEETEIKHEITTCEEDTLSEVALTVTKMKFFYNKNTKIVTSVEKMMS